MRRAPIILLPAVALCLLSCHPSVEERAVRKAVDVQLATYPASRLQDLYKFFFQDRFGPGHIVRDRESALEYILAEMAEEDSLTGPYAEPCGWEGNYVRVSLSAVRDGILSAESLTDALVSSAVPVTEADLRSWKETWARIEAVIASRYPSLPGREEDAASLDSLLASGRYACHHSAAYEKAYHPHYRIIGKHFADSLLQRIQ